MKICSRCYEVYNDEDVTVEDYIYEDTEFGRIAIATDRYLRDCECCGGELVEAKECAICGAWIPEDSEDICDTCLENGITLENALEYGEEATETVELNGLLAALGKETIEKVLTLYLRGQQKIFGNTGAVDGYVNALKDEFIDFIIEKETVMVGG
jgi:hypothetical protein